MHAVLRYLELVVVQPENADVLKDGLEEHISWQTGESRGLRLRVYPYVGALSY